MTAAEEMLPTQLASSLAPGVDRPLPSSFVMPCSRCRRCVGMDGMRFLPGAGLRRVGCADCVRIVAAGAQ